MKDNRKKIIVSTDDFGLRIAANEQILELARLGKVDRVAVLIDGIFTAEEIKALADLDIKIDLHLDWETHKSSERDLTEGAVSRIIVFLFKYCSGKISEKKIRNDWERQLNEFKNIFGRYPDGINSHQHMHFFPSYFSTVIEFVRKNNIPYVRFGSRNVVLRRHLISIVLFFLHWLNKQKYLKSKIRSSDYLISLDWVGEMEKFIEHLPEGETEIVCHPERPEEFKLIKKYF